MKDMTRIVKETDCRGESVYCVEDAWWFFWKKMWFRPEPFLHPRAKSGNAEKKDIEVIEYVN